MKYDLIISNPPYGSPGNTITKNIIENVDYDCFVNLLPSNDYRRFNKKFKLYQFVELNTIRPIIKGFKDAAVTTMLCRVMKERQYSRTQSDFEIENYIDKSLKKYFYENCKRHHYALENYDSGHGQAVTKWTPEHTIIIGLRDIGHGHMPYDKNCTSYKWNIEKSIDWKYVVENHSNPRAAKKNTYEVYYSGINFDTEIEKKNFADFMYSKDGFRFYSKIFTTANRDGGTKLYNFFPKVDWTKPQTVESILSDYGYTEQEIQEVMEDLKRFKGFDQSYTSEDEFEIENYTDKSLKRYFYENAKRSHYAIDNPECGKHPEQWIQGQTFIFCDRDTGAKHFAYTKSSIPFKWNVEHSIDWKYLVENYNRPRAVAAGVYELHFYSVTFNSKNEFENFIDFVYSNNGFRLMSKIMTALSADGFVHPSKWMPKVDWTRPQTVESILSDYGYTEQEISEVMEDLKRFKGFDQSYTSEDEFEIENYGDKSLKKYFYENRKRSHYAVDSFIYDPSFKQFENLTVEQSIYIGKRDPKSKHLPYSLDSITTRYNLNRITKQQVIDESAKSIQKFGKVGDFYLIPFKTEQEKTNLSNFMYSDNGFRFMSKLFTALNCDSSIPLDKFMPKVDWTRPQTVESILLDYNYTPAEIAEILDDLKNYRYMDDTK